MPDRLPTTPSSPKEDPSQDGSRPSAGPDTDTESTGVDTSGTDSGTAGSSGTGSGTAGSSGADNPFAPPPEGSPDRPWQPRQQKNGEQQGGQGGGSRWSSRQPGRSSSPFGQRPGEQDGQGGGQGGPGGSLRWDPTDPVQRRARYALLAGMWGFFFALFSWPYVALLLGALAIHWAVGSLRGRPAGDGKSGKGDRSGKGGTDGKGSGAVAGAEADGRSGAAAGAASAAGAGKPQSTAAISGLVTAILALAMVAATFTAQIVYRDYYTCVNDALTTTAQKSCEKLLPEQLRPFLGAPEEQ